MIGALLLNACSRAGHDEAAFTDSRIPPGLEQRFWPPQAWAWGLVQTGGAPPIRYGVSAPETDRRGDVLILAGFGESAEAWFETVRALNAAGYVVWVMDSAGQGGSGRSAQPRDLVHATDLKAEADAVRAMSAIIGRPAVLVAQSTTGPTALRAILDGARFPALVLSAPVFNPSEPPINAAAHGQTAAWMAKVRLGWMRALGQAPWSGPDRLPKGRGGVGAAWRQANPDLRTGGASWGWLAAFSAQAETLQPTALKRVSAPVWMLTAASGPTRRARDLCGALPRCTVTAIPGGRGPLHLEGDQAYDGWSKAVLAAVRHAFAAEHDA
jgi:lysophospholipase